MGKYDSQTKYLHTPLCKCSVGGNLSCKQSCIHIKPFVMRRSGHRSSVLVCLSAMRQSTVRSWQISGFPNEVKVSSESPACILRGAIPAAKSQKRRDGSIRAACNNDGCSCNTPGACRVPEVWRACVATADAKPRWVENHFCCSGTSRFKTAN